LLFTIIMHLSSGRQQNPYMYTFHTIHFSAFTFINLSPEKNIHTFIYVVFAIQFFSYNYLGANLLKTYRYIYLLVNFSKMKKIIIILLRFCLSVRDKKTKKNGTIFSKPLVKTYKK